MALVKEILLCNNERGEVELQGNDNVPFDIKRVYYIFDTKDGTSRGFHAHKDLQQVVVCISGSCRFVVDDGQSRKEYLLDSPHKGLHLRSPLWREMHDFSDDCVLVVLASDFYNSSDYIKEYDEFKTYVSSLN
ncbi:TPA: WxcM-like domain-containing protein [Vibrio cholerae]|nr:WxcM-like domain-containing protein [Vibrio cholerae]